MTSTIPKLIAAHLLILLAGACASEETDPDAYRSTTTILNSPRTNNGIVPELNLDGRPNHAGMTVAGVRDRAGNRLELDVVGDELVARNAQGEPAVSGSRLIGTRIELRTDVGETKDLYFLDVASIVSWADNTPPMSVYALAYRDATTGRMINICPDAADNPYATAVTVIGGETYDEQTKTVEPDRVGWLTLACEGHAVYKMKRLGYGPKVPFNGGRPSTVAQRNATLKMITGSYCASTGDPTSFTRQDTPIVWANTAGTVGKDRPRAVSIEAKWNEDGAVCWNAPRVPTLVPSCAPVPCDATHVGEWTTWLR